MLGFRLLPQALTLGFCLLPQALTPDFRSPLLFLLLPQQFCRLLLCFFFAVFACSAALFASVASATACILVILASAAAFITF